MTQKYTASQMVANIKQRHTVRSNASMMPLNNPATALQTKPASCERQVTVVENKLQKQFHCGCDKAQQTLLAGNTKRLLLRRYRMVMCLCFIKKVLKNVK